MVNSRVVIGVSISAILIIIGIYYAASIMDGGKTITIKMMEFSYQVEGGSFPLRLVRGETYILKVVNIGGAEHELMIVRNKDMMIEMSQDLINSLLDEGKSEGELIKAFEHAHHEMEEEMVKNGNLLYTLELGPGEEGTLKVSFADPGTYYIVCMEMEGSAPKTHADMGMVAEIIVE